MTTQSFPDARDPLPEPIASVDPVEIALADSEPDLDVSELIYLEALL